MPKVKPCICTSEDLWRVLSENHAGISRENDASAFRVDDNFLLVSSMGSSSVRNHTTTTREHSCRYWHPAPTILDAAARVATCYDTPSIHLQHRFASPPKQHREFLLVHISFVTPQSTTPFR
jgi:hypothetical protein